ncbi:MAG: hypothetical protein E7556_00080 [Ruminococcaceae bacterium]|nr:hypothetical protein [Oscillospiraceae bacterium]
MEENLSKEKSKVKQKEISIIVGSLIWMGVVITGLVFGIFALAESDLTSNMMSINTVIVEPQQTTNNAIPQTQIQQQPKTTIPQATQEVISNQSSNHDIAGTTAVLGYTDAEIKEILEEIEGKVSYLAINVSLLETGAQLSELSKEHDAELISRIGDTERLILDIFEKTYPVRVLMPIWSLCEDCVPDPSMHLSVQARSLRRKADHIVDAYVSYCNMYGVSFDDPRDN